MKDLLSLQENSQKNRHLKNFYLGINTRSLSHSKQNSLMTRKIQRTMKYVLNIARKYTNTRKSRFCFEPLFENRPKVPNHSHTKKFFAAPENKKKKIYSRLGKMHKKVKNFKLLLETQPKLLLSHKTKFLASIYHPLERFSPTQ